MRMVKRTNSNYEQFVEMRQWVLDNCPFALINDIYDGKNRITYLYFWDSDYIPQEWSQWIVRPTTVNKDRIGEQYVDGEKVKVVYTGKDSIVCTCKNCHTKFTTDDPHANWCGCKDSEHIYKSAPYKISAEISNTPPLDIVRLQSIFGTQLQEHIADAKKCSTGINNADMIRVEAIVSFTISPKPKKESD